MPLSDPDSGHMEHALRLARRAEGRTSPNPLVGAVVVRDGKVVGSGYHRGPGHAHAEVIALAAAGDKARGATLYVTLEPCCHTEKRTPPCVPEVIRAQLARVVVGMTDPNPPVAGRGIEALRTAGVDTEAGVLETACRTLNAPYIRVMERGLPAVTLKVAQTLDGKVATGSGESKWITGEAARRHGHRLRARHDVILVGVGTVRADDPALTCRLRGGRNPQRVVVDPRLETPPNAALLTAAPPGPTILVALADADDGVLSDAMAKRQKLLEDAGARVLRLPARDGRLALKGLLKELAAEGHHRVLCEGGPQLSAGLLDEGLVTRLAWFIAPKVLGGADAVGSVGGFSPPFLKDAVELGPMRIRRFGEDILIEADVIDPGEGQPAAHP
ncbi:MAG: bifunctional diaminohydroxyphosphoribosylaminopyrimidine deaminase/5-amino-6-(5-phosphoribosylamino)uracil reductase RibD [Leptospirillia bacterium]